MELLSIVIPVYNVEAKLPRCLDSVLAQKYTPFELILIDDGSADNSGKICDDYASQHDNIKVAHIANQGVSHARNLGIELSLGTYLAFVDSDDFIAPEIYTTLISFTAHNTLPICAAGENPSENPHAKSASLIYTSPNDFLNLCLNFQLNAPWGKIYDAQCLKKNHIQFPTNLSLGEDLIFVLDYLLHVKNICQINQALYFYDHTNTVGLSLKYRSDFYFSQKTILERIRQQFDLAHIDFKPWQKTYYTLAFDLLLQSMNYQFRPECPLTRREIIDFNQKIMDSALFREALQYGDTSTIRPLLKKLYRHGKYRYVFCYLKTIDFIKRVTGK